MADTLAQQVLARFSSAFNWRTRFDGLYQQVSNLMGNGHQFSWNNSAQMTAGVDQSYKYYDSTAVTYRDIMAAMMIGYGANPMTKWFNIRFSDKRVEPDYETRMWFDEVRDEILDNLHTQGGYETLQAINPSFIDYGAGPFYIGEREIDGRKKGFGGYHFEAVPLQNIWIVSDELQRVNGLWRREFMTGYECMEYFASTQDRLPDVIREAAKSMDQNQRFPIINEVLPVKGGDQWMSLWVDQGSAKLLREPRLLKHFPYIVPRDDVFPGEIYPRGRSVKMLATIKEQNMLSRELGFAAGYRARPFMFIRHGTKLDQKAMTPAGLVRYDGEKPEPGNVGGDLSFWEVKYSLNDKTLRRGYFVDQIELTDNRPEDMKATVAAAKINSSRIVLAPLFVHLEYQLYGPLVSTMIKLKLNAMTADERRMMIPKQVIEQDGALGIEVVSPMAKAQQEVDVQAMNNGLQSILNLSPVFPEIRDVLNPDAIAKNYAMLTNTPMTNFRSPAEVQSIRTVKQRIQMQMMQIQAMSQAAPAVKDMAEARQISNEGQ